MTPARPRAKVDGPRPAAAWWMSLVASATLWITELIPLWMIGVQLVAYVSSYATRRHPPAFRTNPIWLNIGMLGITTVTIRAALAGHPATVSLAFFAALAQGLQLLDARPRRTEFVLVALALFQVILASNLTDSILFPPLVLAFLVSVTWTLLVHTLQMEATEAGDPDAAPRAIRADLRRMTAWATGGCLLLALLLFLALPRVKTNMLHGSMAGGLSISGFSDRVRLGTVGQIRKDRSVVLRVEAIDGALPDPKHAYWRALAFDAFDGRSWSVSAPVRGAARRPVAGIGRFGIWLETGASGAARATRRNADAPSTGRAVVQRILREPVDGGVLFIAGRPLRIQGPFQRVERDPNGAIYLSGPSEKRVRYTVWTEPTERNADALRADRAAPPLEVAPGGRRPATRYGALPALDPRLAEIARELIADASTDFDRALRLQDGLRSRGRYTDDPPPMGSDDRTPIEDFLLGERAGHCEYFASAMVVLARTQGLPARLVNGFAGGVRNSLGGFVEVTQSDAHAWVEIHFEKAGWVRFDPTPPDLRLRALETASLWNRIEELGSAVELWWFQRVVDFDSADQIGALRGLWLAWRGGDDADASASRARGPGADPRTNRRWSEALAAQGPVAMGLVGLLLLLILLLSRSKRAAVDDVPEGYRRALTLLERRGLPRAPTTSARAFARRVAHALPAEAADAFDALTERYLEQRFGERVDARESSSPELATLESAVDRVGLRDQADVG